MCGKDNKVFEAEPWRRLDFGLKNRSEQNTEIYKARYCNHNMSTIILLSGCCLCCFVNQCRDCSIQGQARDGACQARGC